MLKAGKAITLPNGELLLQSAPSRYVAWIAIFLLVTLIAWWFQRRRIGGATPVVAFFAAFVIPLLFLPGIAMERVRVTGSHLDVRTGYWFAPMTMRYPLAELNDVQEGRNLRNDLVWTFRYANGRTRGLNLPDLLEGNRPPVVAALRSRGVTVR
jgi:hypothetical protein